jgi:hypothetical protein
MTGLRGIAPLLLIALLGAATVPPAPASPPRPTEGKGNNFYLIGGVEYLEFDLDPRSSDEFVAAGLDPTVADPGFILGAGWAFARPLRLELNVSGWRGDIDREGVDCFLARIGAELGVALLDGRNAALEATFSYSFLSVVYDGLGDDAAILGSTIGLGGTGRWRLLGPLGLGVTYQYQLGRFQPKTFSLPDQEPFRVNPTSRAHGVRLSVYLDL